MIKFARIGRLGIQALMGFAVAGLLTACGGGGGSAGTPILGGGTGGGTTPSSVKDLSVVLDKTSVSNAGTDLVTLTVTSVDANNSVVGSVPVTFAIDSGVITPGGTTTNATTGVLTATAQLGADHTNRTVNVTVTAGAIVKKVSFDVVDSVSGGKVADLAMTVDKATIANDGSQSAVVTVTSVDANRNAIGGSPVSFKIADIGDAVISTAGKTSTDAVTGQITATVSLGSNHANRTISVTATSGTVQRTISFAVVNPQTSTPVANDLAVALDTSNIDNSGSRVVNATVTAVDALRNAIGGIPVQLSVDSGVITPNANQTDSKGQVTAAVSIGSDHSNRLITITATSGTLVRTASFVVTGANLQATALPTLPSAGSAGNKIEYLLSDINKNPMIGVPITVSGAGLTSTSGTTDGNGAYTFTYTAPLSPGAIDINASGGGATSLVTVTVSSGATSVPPAATTVVSASVSASPNVVKVNTTDTSNRSQLQALFLGANNAPIKNIRVRFDLNGDANNVGGTLSAGTSIVYSDAGGAATTSYTPAARSSPTNGVSIRACWDYNDFASPACPNQVLTSLTVVSDPLSITIGTDETLADGDTGLTYVKKYVVLVVDAAGNPKSDVQITPSLDLSGYLKGYYIWDAANSIYVRHYALDGVDTIGTAQTCLSEDINRNGSIDSGEDKNNNGQLDPRKSDASISMVSSTKTDSNGTAVLKIEYPKSVAGWVNFTINAAAAGVLSPPAIYAGTLPVSAAALKTQTPPPAFVQSPYGLRRNSADASFCTNAN